MKRRKTTLARPTQTSESLDSTKIKTKIWWRDFHGTEAFLEVQKVLAKHNLHMKVEYIYDPVEGKVATDVHILQVEK